jgi:hypothetical protein
MGVKVQVGLGRFKSSVGDVSEPLDHRLVRRVGTEPGNVPFRDIDALARTPDPLGRELTNRATGGSGIELSTADRPPCT